MIAFSQAVIKNTAQAGFFIKVFAWRAIVYNNFAGGRNRARITALPAAAAQIIPIFSPLPEFCENMDHCFQCLFLRFRYKSPLNLCDESVSHAPNRLYMRRFRRFFLNFFTKAVNMNRHCFQFAVHILSPNFVV